MTTSAAHRGEPSDSASGASLTVSTGSNAGSGSIRKAMRSIQGALTTTSTHALVHAEPLRRPDLIAAQTHSDQLRLTPADDADAFDLAGAEREVDARQRHRVGRHAWARSGCDGKDGDSRDQRQAERCQRSVKHTPPAAPWSAIRAHPRRRYWIRPQGEVRDGRHYVSSVLHGSCAGRRSSRKHVRMALLQHCFQLIVSAGRPSTPSQRPSQAARSDGDGSLRCAGDELCVLRQRPRRERLLGSPELGNPSGDLLI